MSEIAQLPDEPSRDGPKKGGLLRIGEQALRAHGWTVERVRGSGKSSMRRITRQNESHLVSIRTSRDTWIAFPRTSDDSGWITLDEVDFVVAVSVDDRDAPRFAQVHMVPAAEMRDRFDRGYAARKAAGHRIDLARGIWMSLYEKEATDRPSLVGAGAGRDHPPIARAPLSGEDIEALAQEEETERGEPAPATLSQALAAARQLIARAAGLPESSVEITIRA